MRSKQQRCRKATGRLGGLSQEPLSGVGRGRPPSEMLGFCVSCVGQRRWVSAQFLAQFG